MFREPDAVAHLRSEWAAVNPESGTTTFAYNSKGLLSSKTTGLGTLTYEYDSLSRLLKVKQCMRTGNPW